MAYVFRSNNEVENPDIQFEYLDDGSIDSFDMANYKAKIRELGYSLTSTENSALSILEKELRQIGVYNNIYELLPLFGTTPEQKAVKFKFINSQEATISGTLSVDSKGLVFTTRPTSNAPRLLLDFKLQDFIDMNGVGHISYIKRQGGVIDVGQFRSIIHSSGLTIGERGDFSSILINHFNASMSTTNVFGTNSRIVIDKSSLVNGYISQRAIYYDGVLVANTNTPVAMNTSTLDPNLDTAIGARTTGAYGFEGYIRFIAVHDGNIADGIIPNLNRILQTFFIATEKDKF